MKSLTLELWQQANVLISEIRNAHLVDPGREAVIAAADKNMEGTLVDRLTRLKREVLAGRRLA